MLRRCVVGVSSRERINLLHVANLGALRCTNRRYCSITKDKDFSQFTPERIRNFCIIAHIDHGKTTLSDRLMESTGTIVGSGNKSDELVLDKLQVEKERGITVKAQTCSMLHTYTENGQKKEILLNLIDTPGHVDFSYEVSRSLSICQSALLLVDCLQGIQAQTISNLLMAFDQGLDIIPVINKIDLAPDQTTILELEAEIRNILLEERPIFHVSARSGQGVKELLDMTASLKHPPSNLKAPLKAVLFDSWYESYRGVICLISIIDGQIIPGDVIKSSATGNSYEVIKVGFLNPAMTFTQGLSAGQVGFIITTMRNRNEAKTGDTFYHEDYPIEPVPGFKETKPMVFSGLYPEDPDLYGPMKEAMEKITLTDAGVTFTQENNSALGNGYRCGFLGVLHMEVFTQRMEQEFGVSVLNTAPSVPYKLVMRDGTEVEVTNPEDFPSDSSTFKECWEPVVRASIIAPSSYYGSLMALCANADGEQESIEHIDDTRIRFIYTLPLSEVVTDFYDNLKQCTAGLASFDYEDGGYREADHVKLDIRVNGEILPPLSIICRRDRAQVIGRRAVEKLKTKLPRQLFVVPIQAVIGTKSIARVSISALRKDVTAKCYGGDITRKRKLLDKQKEGKKRMRSIGNLEVSKSTLQDMLRR